MTYDGLDRLRTAASPMFGTANYGFDVLDNLTDVKVTGGAAPRDHTYHYTLNRLSSVTDNATGATVVGLAHDDRGNLSNKNGVLYDFDFGNRLRKVVGQEHYRYDGLGRRVLQWSATGLGNLLSQYDRQGRLVYQHDERVGKGVEHVYLADRLVARRERNVPGEINIEVTYLHTDALGSPAAATNASRTVVQRSEYEPFGLLANRANDNRAGFTGHVMDAVTGLTYMEERYYDPGIGMFLSVDPVTAYSNPVGQFHRYRYANNNPYKFIDPDGRENVLGVLAKLPEEVNNPSTSDLKVQAAAQKSVDLTVNAVVAGGTAEQIENAGRWKVTVDPRASGAPKTGKMAETRTGTTPDGNVAVVETFYSNRIRNVAEEDGTVTLTGMTADGGDAALLAVGAHELGHSTSENRAMPAGQAKEANASAQAVQLGASSPEVSAGAIQRCDKCF